MATPYSKRRVLMDDIATRNVQNYKRIVETRNVINSALSDANATITNYKTVTDEIAADPKSIDNEAFKLMQLELEEMLNETGQIINQATEILNAIDAVLNK